MDGLELLFCGIVPNYFRSWQLRCGGFEVRNVFSEICQFNHSWLKKATFIILPENGTRYIIFCLQNLNQMNCDRVSYVRDFLQCIGDSHSQLLRSGILTIVCVQVSFHYSPNVFCWLVIKIWQDTLYRLNIITNVPNSCIPCMATCMVVHLLYVLVMIGGFGFMSYQTL